MKTRKTPRKSLIKKLDRDFSLRVRLRNKCERCGKTENLQCAHIISRTYQQVRWDEDNALCLCAGCHIYWWHKEPIEAARWLEEHWPGRYDRINQKRHQVSKLDLESLYETVKI